MIAVLQGAGGLRESEPFHLFLDDVHEDPRRLGSAPSSVFITLARGYTDILILSNVDGSQNRAQSFYALGGSVRVTSLAAPCLPVGKGLFWYARSPATSI